MVGDAIEILCGTGMLFIIKWDVSKDQQWDVCWMVRDDICGVVCVRAIDVTCDLRAEKFTSDGKVGGGQGCLWWWKE